MNNNVTGVWQVIKNAILINRKHKIQNRKIGIRSLIKGQFWRFHTTFVFSVWLVFAHIYIPNTEYLKWFRYKVDTPALPVFLSLGSHHNVQSR